MDHDIRIPRRGALLHLAAFSVSGSLAGIAHADEAPRRDKAKLRKPVYRVAETSDATGRAGDQKEHPLQPAIRMARAALDNIDKNVSDYTCTLVKRERVNGKLGNHEFIFTKVRHRPFSVYMYFLAPEASKGQEALYVQGKNENKLLGHAGSGLRARFGTISLAPTGMVAMQGQRYPITEVGVRNLTARLVKRAESSLRFENCEVLFFKNTRIGKGEAARLCTCIQVMHPQPRQGITFHRARIFVDDKLNMPIRYEAHDFPTSAGANPPLLEEYTYLNLKPNVGLTGADFDSANSDYSF